jgi:outer membrane lipoprotein carrier protein
MRAPLIILFSILTIAADAQSDQQAIKILDRFSAAALGAPSVSMKFRMVNTDQKENRQDSSKGSIILSRDKYRLEMTDNIVWFNGETQWSYLPAEKEVTITEADKKDNSFRNRPSAIFSMYRKGYKSRLVEEKPDSYIIDLYPEDIRTDLLRVRITIGKSLMNLLSLEYKGRDGIIITIYIEDYNLKTKPDPATFIFPSAKYKDAEVVDMR